MLKKYSTTVNAPVLQCFEFITAKRIQRWLGGDMVTEYGMLAEDAMVGAPYKLTYGSFWELIGEITAYEKPKIFGVDFTSNVASTKGKFTYHFVELEPKKTEVTFELEIFDDNPVRQAAISLLSSKIDEAANSHLQTIKEIVESKVY